MIRPHQLSSEGLPDGQYTVHIVDGVVSWSPTTPSDPLVTVIGGEPSLVFDRDGQIVYVEG